MAKVAYNIAEKIQSPDDIRQTDDRRIYDNIHMNVTYSRSGNKIDHQQQSVTIYPQTRHSGGQSYTIRQIDAETIISIYFRLLDTALVPYLYCVVMHYTQAKLTYHRTECKVIITVTINHRSVFIVHKRFTVHLNSRVWTVESVSLIRRTLWLCFIWTFIWFCCSLFDFCAIYFTTKTPFVHYCAPLFRKKNKFLSTEVILKYTVIMSPNKSL